jgi:hypothetical protein
MDVRDEFGEWGYWGLHGKGREKCTKILCTYASNWKNLVIFHCFVHACPQTQAWTKTNVVSRQTNGFSDNNLLDHRMPAILTTTIFLLFQWFRFYPKQRLKKKQANRSDEDFFYYLSIRSVGDCEMSLMKLIHLIW